MDLSGHPFVHHNKNQKCLYPYRCFFHITEQCVNKCMLSLTHNHNRLQNIGLVILTMKDSRTF